MEKRVRFIAERDVCTCAGEWGEVAVLTDSSGGVVPSSLSVERLTKGQPSLDVLVFDYANTPSPPVERSASAEKVWMFGL